LSFFIGGQNRNISKLKGQKVQLNKKILKQQYVRELKSLYGFLSFRIVSQVTLKFIQNVSNIRCKYI